MAQANPQTLFSSFLPATSRSFFWGGQDPVSCPRAPQVSVGKDPGVGKMKGRFGHKVEKGNPRLKPGGAGAISQGAGDSPQELGVGRSEGDSSDRFLWRRPPLTASVMAAKAEPCQPTPPSPGRTRPCWSPQSLAGLSSSCHDPAHSEDLVNVDAVQKYAVHVQVSSSPPTGHLSAGWKKAGRGGV